MSDAHTGSSLLHRLTHKIPGVPAHVEHPPGHQGPEPRRHHHPDRRPPRVLVGWQRRIAALFGRDLP